MCGIAGDIAFKTPAQQALDINGMLETLRFRGPDEVGEAHGEGWAVGARRLSVVAPDNGAQPFVGARGTQCVFNGEIYNHKELRGELERQGVHFATNSDGEVIVHLYERDGLGFIHRLRGMFAIALYDPNERCVILVRDRIGKKPLFYYHDPANSRVVFGSSLNAVVAAPRVPRRIDLDAIDYYLSYRIIPAPLTVYRDIRKVEAGSVAVFESEGAKRFRYWKHPQLQTSPLIDESALVDELRDLLCTAVERRIPDDVPYGLFLSGGLDSSLITALTAQRRGAPLQAFSVGFANAAFDERPIAREVAKAIGVAWHQYEITPADALVCARELSWHFGEPFGFPSSIACFYMSRMARERATVALGGDGADELFGGYRRYRRLLDLRRSASAQMPLRDSPAAIAADYEPILADGLRKEWKTDIASREFVAGLGLSFPQNRLMERIEPTADVDFLNRILALDCGFWLTDAQMVKVDVASMANSLEVRHPLLDETIVEFAAKLPESMKLRGEEVKYLLRRAAEPFVPERALHREKQELAAPLEDWFTGALRDEIVSTLTSQACLSRGYFAPDRLRRFVETFDASRVYAIWTLYVLEMWHIRHHDEVVLTG